MMKDFIFVLKIEFAIYIYSEETALLLPALCVKPCWLCLKLNLWNEKKIEFVKDVQNYSQYILNWKLKPFYLNISEICKLGLVLGLIHWLMLLLFFVYLVLWGGDSEWVDWQNEQRFVVTWRGLQGSHGQLLWWSHQSHRFPSGGHRNNERRGRLGCRF